MPTFSRNVTVEQLVSGSGVVQLWSSKLKVGSMCMSVNAIVGLLCESSVPAPNGYRSTRRVLTYICIFNIFTKVLASTKIVFIADLYL
jgi:hypothetical protein